jgi:hypothetical protein
MNLEHELQHLDQQIAGIREQREKSQDTREKERLARSIESLDIHERAAIKKFHKERDERHQREEQAAQQYQQKRADKQEQEDRRMLRMRWTGNDASFDAAYPKMLEQLRMDRALGRSTADTVPSTGIEF